MKKLILFCLLILSHFGWSQTYTEIDKIIASDRAEFSRFGQSVAISDNYAVVGAYAEGPYNNGQVYIFEKQGANWVQTQILQNSDNENYDRFGWSVAIDGDWMIVGASGEDDDENGNNNISKAGSVYIYKNIAGTWTQVQKIVASDRSADDEFGWALDIDGNTIIVGAHQDFEDVNGLNPIHHAGSCYFYDLNTGTGVWSQTQKIVANDRAPDLYYPNGYSGEDLSDQFGHSVGISGNYVIVGAINHDYRPDGSSAWQTGSAYIFERSGGVWTEAQHIINSDNSAGIWERFGSDVAIDSNVIVCGSWSQDYTANGTDYMKNAGAAYIFVRDLSGNWNENQKIVAGMRNSGDHFGWDVKINDGFIIAGTEHDDENENENTPLVEAGSAYIFQVDGNGMYNQIQKIVGSDRDSLDVFGYAVDVFGANIIAGAFQHDWNLVQADSMQEAGAAYIWSSSTCTPVINTQSATICNGETYTVGTSVYSTMGTFNDYFTAANGCDSIVITNLTVNPTYDTTVTVTICDGDSYSVGNSTYTAAGSYTDVLSTTLGCDSTVTTILTLNPTYTINQNIEICEGDTYIIGTSTYSSTGNYTDVFTSISGCDSTIITNLIVNPTYDTTVNVTICTGDVYSVGTSTYNANGNYTDILTSINGCDSTVNTNLTVVTLDNTTNVSGFTISANQSNATYQWIDCNDNNSPILGETNQSFTATQNGDFAVIVFVGNCSDTSDCVTIEGVGINENDFSKLIDIYPNPSTGQFSINLDLNNESYDIKIMDVTGKVIYTKTQLTDSKLAIDLNTVANGIYFIEIKTLAGQTTKKIRIQY